MLLERQQTLSLCTLAKMGICAKRAYSANISHFAYRIEDIIKEVHKRTTYIGANRRTKEGQTLVDAIAYTADEFDMDIPLTKDAMANVFTPLYEYAQGLGESYLYNEQTNTHVLAKTDIAFESEHVISTSSNAIKIAVTSDTKVPNDHYINIKATVTYEVTDIFENKTTKTLQINTSLGCRNYDEAHGKYTYTLVTTPNYAADTEDNGLGADKIVVKSVTNIEAKVMCLHPTVIKKGDWIEVTENGVKKLYIAKHDCTSNVVLGNEDDFEYMDFDFRGTIHYVLWFPNMHNSHGILEALDDHLFEALVLYIIYRWLKIVYPEEAASWYEDFENRIIKITELLDSQNGGIVSRGFVYV